MNNEYNLLLKFKSIAKSRWIRGINNNTNSVGLTFESLLNKSPDSEFFPDYNGIEIKCTQRFSRYPITLFTKSFDGPSFFEMNRLLEKYGKKDVIYRDKKLLNVALSTKDFNLFNDKYYFKIKIDKTDQKLYLLIYNLNYEIIEDNSYITFESIKNHLEFKLSKLAIIWASKKIEYNYSYFRYYKIELYKIRSFDKFIELIENGIIKLELVGRISRSGDGRGRQRNKNVVFKIDKGNINLLFENIGIYNHDSKFEFMKKL